MRKSFFLAILVISNLPAFGGEADVLNVDISCSSDTRCRFNVTVKHDDDGWKHYVIKWEVLTPDGKVLAIRELAHPHDNEQPFTRSLGNVKIPRDLNEVVVRAHDSIHGTGGTEIVVKVPK